jgi:hypothetical protein
MPASLGEGAEAPDSFFVRSLLVLVGLSGSS